MPARIGSLTEGLRRARALKLVTAAAIANTRCPTNDEVGVGSLPALAREGLIKIAIFANNWRVVTLMTGEHAGKATLAAPVGKRPYRVVYKDHVQFRRAMP